MTQLRHDPLFDRTVLIAEQRAERPNDFAAHAIESQAPQQAAGSCPFCAGHESQTPPAVYEVRDAQGTWRARVVPNRYPAVQPDAAAGSAGVHEVVIESPRHLEHTSDLSPAELSDVLACYRQRLQHWRRTERFRYGLVFKNVGAAAGASLLHLHSQVLALAEVPTAVDREFARMSAFYEQTGSCGLCARLADERAATSRIVCDDGSYLVFCPEASLQPYETWVVPCRHQPHFEDALLADGERLAAVLHDALCRVERVVPGGSYNVFACSAPWNGDASRGHWRIEIRPRLTALAGLELATAIHINQVSPERAADSLRNG